LAFVISGLADCHASISLTPGPAYVPNAPLVEEDVCPYNWGPQRRAVASCQENSYCWTTTLLPSYRVKVQGFVREAGSCKNIPNATIEIWTTDSGGQYSYFFDIPEHRGCWGTILSKSGGDYSFITWRPGSYGFDAGLLPFAIPPLLPQHIHVAVYAPGYKLLITQMYFEDDPAREWDWREALGGYTLEAKNKALELHLVDDGIYQGVPLKTAKFDFGLRKDEDKISLFDQWNWYCLHDSPTPVGFCDPPKYELIAKYAPKAILGCSIIFAVGVIYLVKRCFGKK